MSAPSATPDTAVLYPCFDAAVRQHLATLPFPLTLESAGPNTGSRVASYRMLLRARGAEILLSFVASTHVPGYCGVSVTVSRGERNFLLNHYLRFMKLKGEAHLSFNTNDTPYAQGIENAVAFTFELFAGLLRPVLEGTIWVEVPFDWEGHR